MIGVLYTFTMTIQPLTAKIATMSINVQFFASLRESVGQQHSTLDYAVDMDVSAVWQQASNGTEMPVNTLCAINMEYVKADAQVSDGDEVAFFPPVTGG